MSQYEGAEPMTDAERAIGRKLREHRRTAGMSLHDVEVKSDRAWKAVVIGSYERGDRRMTLGRFLRLCAFYGLPPSALLPDEGDATLRARFLDELADELRAEAAVLRGDAVVAEVPL